MRRLATALVPVAIGAAVPFAAPRQSCADRQVVAFVGADVLSMSDSILRRGQDVVVRGARIESVGGGVPDDACRIDARGKVLLPGLADLHVHTSAREMPLFLANGVTLVREMNGSARHVALRDSVAAGRLLGPRLLVASTLLTGQQWPVRYRLIQSVDDARAAAAEAKTIGYDFLKIYDGLSGDQYDALVESGRALQLPLDGHIPRAVGLPRVLESGQALQHMDKIAFALAGHSPDTTKLDEARRLFQNRRTWVTPTLASLRALDRSGTVEYESSFQRSEMDYVDSASLGWWRSLARSGSRPAVSSPFYRFQTALAAVLKASGARFLLGTDAANPLMVAGFSVHREMQVLVDDAGFSRYEVLLMATRNPAEFLGEARNGVVQAGARADLILVDGDPLRDLAAIRRPVGVMIGGRWLDRLRLDSLLSSSRLR